MNLHTRAPIQPVQCHGCEASLAAHHQRELLAWQLPTEFTIRDLAGEIGKRVSPRDEKHSAALAEATLRAWIKTGRITGAGQIGGLPSYRRTS